MLFYIAIFVLSFLVTFLFLRVLIPRLKRFGFKGRDVNKKGKPEVAEMGGIAIVAGLTAGILLAIFFHTIDSYSINLPFILAGLITILSLAFIGILDDLLDIPQAVKAFLPIFAAIPLIAVTAAGSTAMSFPFIGTVDFGLFYLLILVPIGIAVASNLTNMLAGFNGMESGMGIVIFAVMSLLGFSNGNHEILIFSIPMLAALIGFFPYNIVPAKVFPGDVGNLTIGATLATAVIIGNLESAGAILMVPFVIDFFIKLWNKFPNKNWWGELKEGKLYPLGGKVRGFAQLVMKLFNGIEEYKLTLVFMFIELFFGLVVIWLYF
ncbi:hypothetical protein KAW38_02310 [Candidatus Micrarchaeota archaeon]|nr:hypothetical protein [Candidatus Micrarchaeota archaeon]